MLLAIVLQLLVTSTSDFRVKMYNLKHDVSCKYKSHASYAKLVSYVSKSIFFFTLERRV